MQQQAIIFLTFLVSIAISTISVGPNGGVRLTPGSSKVVTTNSPVLINNGGVTLLNQIDSVAGNLGFISQAYPAAVNTLAIQYIPTINATGSALLAIGTDWYLAVTQNGASPLVFKWNNGTEQFVLWDNFNSTTFAFATGGYQGASFFAIGTQYYLAFAGSVPFVAIQDATGHFGTQTPIPIYLPGTTTVGADLFLDPFSITNNGVTSYYLLEATITGSILRLWNGTNFDTSIQSFPGHLNYETEHFVIGGTTYISINNFNTTVDIYSWNSTAFILLQKLPATNPRTSTFFQVAGNSFLAVAENGASFSTLWQFNNGMFTSYQNIPTRAAWLWHHFTVAGIDFLGLANYNVVGFEGYYVASKLLGWTGLQFATYASVATTGATSVRGFTSNGIDYVFATNSYNNQTIQANSVVYRLTPL